MCDSAAQADQQFCRSCGAGIAGGEDATEKIIKLQFSANKLPNRSLMAVSRLHRLAANCIDFWVILFIIYVLSGCRMPDYYNVSIFIPNTPVIALLFSLCLLLRESGSPGKHAMGLMVTRLKTGDFASLPRRLLRESTLIIPLMAATAQGTYSQLYLLAFLFELLMVLSDKQGRRLGDILAGTVVERRRSVPAKWAWTVFAVSAVMLLWLFFLLK